MKLLLIFSLFLLSSYSYGYCSKPSYTTIGLILSNHTKNDEIKYQRERDEYLDCLSKERNKILKERNKSLEKIANTLEDRLYTIEKTLKEIKRKIK